MSSISNTNTSLQNSYVNYYQTNKGLCVNDITHKTDHLFRCSACRIAHYCSRDCQKLDWSRHKKVCKLLMSNTSLENFDKSIQMSLSSKSLSRNISPTNSVYPVEECKQIRNRLGAHVAKAIHKIASIGEFCKTNYLTDPTLLTKGFWYAQDLANALLKSGTEENKKKYLDLREASELVHGKLPAQFFKFLKRDFEWVLHEGVKPSTALKALENGFEGVDDGLVIIDCGNAVTIARYLGLLNYLEEVNGSIGIQKFDRLFCPPFGESMNLSYLDTKEQPMRHFIVFTDAAKAGISNTMGKRPVKIGQAISMNGVPNYFLKHPCSQGSNFNVICLQDGEGEQLYSGHGLGEKGMDEIAVCRMMAEEYNAVPDHEIRVPEKLLYIYRTQGQTLDLFAKHQVNTQNPEQSVRGYDPHSPQDFEIRLIYDLARSPLEQISMNFITSHPHRSQEFQLTESGGTQFSINF